MTNSRTAPLNLQNSEDKLKTIVETGKPGKISIRAPTLQRRGYSCLNVLVSKGPSLKIRVGSFVPSIHRSLLIEVNLYYLSMYLSYEMSISSCL